LSPSAADGPEVSTKYPRVTIRVLPFASGAYGAVGCGRMVVLRLVGGSDLGVVHLDGVSRGICLTGQEDVARHLDAFGCLKTFALSPEESRRLIQEIARA
jgi:hypothetical protein